MIHRREDPPQITEAADHIAKRRLLLQEIERIVRAAKKRGEILRTGDHAGRLAELFSDTFSVGHIIDEIIVVAARKGVVVEMNRPQ